MQPGQQNSTAFAWNSNSLGTNPRPHSGQVRPGTFHNEYPQPLHRMAGVAPGHARLAHDTITDQSSGAPSEMRRRNSDSSFPVSGPMRPAPITRSPMALTPMISAAVPVRNLSIVQ
jgi:hypothetical protein